MVGSWWQHLWLMYKTFLDREILRNNLFASKLEGYKIHQQIERLKVNVPLTPAVLKMQKQSQFNQKYTLLLLKMLF